MNYLKAERLNEVSILPFRATDGSAGFDLFSVENCTIFPQTRKLIDIGWAFEIQTGYYGRIAPRSSMSIKGIDVGAGVIDSDYRGPVKILLINNSNQSITVHKKDKIAQLLLEKIGMCHAMEVGALDETKRKSGGFGSTDLNYIV